MTKYRAIFEALSAPFDQSEVKRKPVTGFKYITIRTVMNRLDEVLGPENWWDERSDTKRGVKCRLTIRLPDGVTITHEGHCRHMPDPPRSAWAAERIGKITDPMAREKAERTEELRRWDAIQLADDATEADAFKRSAVKFGVARYLYEDGVPVLTDPPAATQIPAETPVAGPSEPAPEAKPAKKAEVQTGDELLEYAKGCKIDPTLHGWIMGHFRKLKYPAKIGDWSPAQVATALPMIRRHLEEVMKSKQAVA